MVVGVLTVAITNGGGGSGRSNGGDEWLRCFHCLVSLVLQTIDVEGEERGGKACRRGVWEGF